MWQLGDSRLVCGDCADPATRAAALDGYTPQALVFDPPWDAVTWTPQRDRYASVLVFTGGRRITDAIQTWGAPTWLFVWDGVSSWVTPKAPLQRAKLCLWYGARTAYNRRGSHYGEPVTGGPTRNPRGAYVVKPKPGRILADLYQYPLTRLHRRSDPLSHPHAKPPEWVRCLIANCTRGDLFDPYAGGGSTLLACAELGRRSACIEQSPEWCAVILERYCRRYGKETLWTL